MRALMAATLAASLALAAQTAPRADATAQREDLAAFEQDFFHVDRSYTTEARVEAARRLAALKTSVGTISDVRFMLTLAQIAALNDNGHSSMIDRGSPGDGRVGVRLVPFGRDFHVVHAVANHAALLGARLIGIDDTPIEQLVDSARTLAGGVIARRDRLAHSFLESPAEMHAMGLARADDRALYQFMMRDGTRREAMLTVVPRPAGDVNAFGGAAILYPMNPSNGWRSLLTAGRAPWSLRDPQEEMRFRDAPELDATVIQLRTNLDGAQPIARFLERADSARRAAGRANVVLDMRMNPGGNLTLTDSWMRSLPSRLPPKGRVVLLTSPWTFSAAISGTGYVKQAGGDRVVLVGEAPGDRLRFWAEGRGTMLPRSGAWVGTATGRHDYITGCRGYSDCLRYMVTHPIAVQTLEPQVAAPWTIESYATGRDPGMEAAARVLAARH